VRDHIRRNVVGYLALFLFAVGGTATALQGRNSVDSGDIRSGQVRTSDLAIGAVTRAKIRSNAVNGRVVADDSLTGTDIDESSFVRACPAGMTLLADVCFSEIRDFLNFGPAALDCHDEGLRLPTLSEAMMIETQTAAGIFVWAADTWFVDPGPVLRATTVAGTGGSFGLSPKDAASATKYRCVISPTP
jgi:hypothetical protein